MGVEPTTVGLKVQRSTTELTGLGLEFLNQNSKIIAILEDIFSVKDLKTFVNTSYKFFEQKNNKMLLKQ